MASTQLLIMNLSEVSSVGTAQSDVSLQAGVSDSESLLQSAQFKEFLLANLQQDLSGEDWQEFLQQTDNKEFLLFSENPADSEDTATVWLQFLKSHFSEEAGEELKTPVDETTDVVADTDELQPEDTQAGIAPVMISLKEEGNLGQSAQRQLTAVSGNTASVLDAKPEKTLSEVSEIESNLIQADASEPDSLRTAKPVFDETAVNQFKSAGNINQPSDKLAGMNSELATSEVSQDELTDELVKAESSHKTDSNNETQRSVKNELMDKVASMNGLATGDRVHSSVQASADATLQNVSLATQPATFSSTAQTSAHQVIPQQMQTLMLSNPNDAGEMASALGERLGFMVNHKLSSAEIRLDPPHLGKLEISVNLSDDRAEVSIHTHHAATRELIDASTQRLREALQQAGFSSVDVNVSQQQQQHASQSAVPEDNAVNSMDADESADMNQETDDAQNVSASVFSPWSTAANLRLDLFA